MSFSATLAGQTYTDPTLFEVDATAWRKAQKMRSHDKYRDGDMTQLYGPPFRGESAAMVEGIRKGWKAPRLTDAGKPFQPAEFEPGAWLSLRIGGQVVPAQVWGKAPHGCVWVVTDEQRAYCVRPRSGWVALDEHGTGGGRSAGAAGRGVGRRRVAGR